MNSTGEQIPNSRDLSALRQSRRLHFLRAALVGICAACVAIIFQWSIEAVSSSFQYFSNLSNSPLLKGIIIVFLCSTCGLVSGYLTQKYAPEAGGSGIPHVKAVLLHLRDLRFIRLIPVKFIGGALAIGSGFSLGREGPTVHLGASVADGLAKLLKVPLRSRNHLIACGAGAGLAAAFNAPLAGFLFVIEELRRELSPITYGAAFIAAVIADGVTRFFFGTAPSLNLSVYSTPSLASLPTILIIGIIVGIGGIIFNRTLLFGLKRLPASLPLWKRAAAVGVVIGLTTLLIPYSTSNLQGTIDHFLQTQNSASIAMWVFGLYFLLKYVLTAICYLTGIPGGIFAPMLAQGALLGVFTGRLCNIFFPFAALPDGIYGIIGMSAFFAASVRAPLTGVVLIAEMTNNFDLLFLLLVASLISYLLAELLGDKPIYEALMGYELRKKGSSVESEDQPVIIDVVVEPNSKMAGMKVRDLKLQQGCLIITVRKQGIELVPHGETIIHEGDELAFLVDRRALTQLIELKSAAAGPSLES